MTTPSLMAYVPGSRVTSMSSSLIVPDWANNRFYSPYDAGSGGTTGGVSQFTGYISGDVSRAKNVTDLAVDQVSSDPMCLTYNGNLIAPAGSGANSEQLLQIRAADLKLLSTFSIPSSNTSASDATHILSPGHLVPARWGRTDYVIATPFALNKGEVSILTIPGLGLTNLGNTAETGAASLGPGAVGSSVGSAYVLGRDTNVFAIYIVRVPALTLAKLATFHPAGIDATWSTFSAVNGVAYDQTDGNILIGVQTTDAVTNQSYICKFNGTTGALIWKAICPYFTADMDEGMQRSSIKNGTFYVWGNYSLGVGSTLYTITTSTGAISSQVIGDMQAGVGQVSEDTNNSITMNAIWAESTTHPTYIGTYMGAGGHHSYNGWMRFFPSGATAPLPPAPPPVPSSPPVISVNRAWSYTLDGHVFYVLDIGAQGTFVYDTVTRSWASFATGTLPTDGSPEPQWNMQNGCQWGNRVVGFDLTTPNLWEMAPATTLDNDTTAISHACTAGLSTRSRTFISCSAIRISASFGLLDSVSAVNFNLRYSDDQGVTWSSNFPVSLTPGATAAEIAYRSMGSFCAPGRVFELTDVGGLIRIDGADAFLDGFDNDQQTQDAGA